MFAELCVNSHLDECNIEMNEAFDAYLQKKGIDPHQFFQSNNLRYEKWVDEFEATGEKAFDLRKKFFWNDLRITCGAKFCW